MLSAIHIRDLAIVDRLDLELAPGFTVLTGETGAGKSILLTALSLALGDRADPGRLRPGAGRIEVHLEFDLNDAPAARDWLAEQDLAEDAGRVILRRVVSAEGRSKGYINGAPVPLQSLQVLGEQLLEIHGQHAHLGLLNAAVQRRMLDDYAGAQSLAAEVQEAYRSWHALDAELAAALADTHDRRAREELLRYQIDELEQAGVEQTALAELDEEHRRLAHVDRILAVGQAQLERLDEDEHHATTRQLHQAAHELAELAQYAPEFRALAELLESASIQVEEASQGLRRLLDAQEADPGRLEWIEQRLGLFHQLARKHQTRPEHLVEILPTLRTELERIEHGEAHIARLRALGSEAAQRYDELAATLSARRAEAASRLAQRITGMIRELGMPQGDFQIRVTTDSAAGPRPHGHDAIEFLVSANPGLPPRPLAKVASGGELSRISLAIKVATIDTRSTPTLIFDEVDTGIGGGVAEIVGNRLRTLGTRRQVLCVTHLPQVAAQGNQHLLVEKRTDGVATTSSVYPLDAEERRHEIARMLGGVRITQQTLAHADEMLAWHPPS